MTTTGSGRGRFCLPIGRTRFTMPARVGQLATGVLATYAVGLVVIHFHDRFWWPPDDGAYAYVAQRLLHGDVLSADVQDIHAGYVHFINAAAMRVFGEDIVSLRYPLALLTVIQALIVYILLVPKGSAAAFAGAVASGSLSFVQFLNPTANWYALFLAFALIGCMHWLRAVPATRLVVIGFLLASAVLFRQLSGIFLAMGAIAALLAEPPPAEGDGGSRLGRATLLIMGAGLSFYLLNKGSLSGFFMFGIGPLAALALIWPRVRIADRDLLSMYALLSLGAVLATLPLLSYLILHGTAAAWFEDVAGAALSLNGLPFVSQPSFGLLFGQTVFAVLSMPSIAGVLSGAFWLTLLSMPAAAWLLMYRRASAGEVPGEWHPAILVAVFFAPVSLHYQIPIYLTYTSCLSLTGLFFLMRGRRQLQAMTALAVALSATGLTLHAGQPLSRGLIGIIRGDTVPLDAPDGINRASIAMELADARTYGKIVAAIAHHAAAGDRILTLPFIPEFYFLSGRQSAVRFLGVPFGIRSDSDLAQTLAKLAADPPRVVINRREDKYHSGYSTELLEWVERNYVFLEAVGDFDVYIVPASMAAEPRGTGAADR
jgi:hypothetical protein